MIKQIQVVVNYDYYDEPDGLRVFVLLDDGNIYSKVNNGSWSKENWQEEIEKKRINNKT